MDYDDMEELRLSEDEQPEPNGQAEALKALDEISGELFFWPVEDVDTLLNKVLTLENYIKSGSSACA